MRNGQSKSLFIFKKQMSFLSYNNKIYWKRKYFYTHLQLILMIRVVSRYLKIFLFFSFKLSIVTNALNRLNRVVRNTTLGSSRSRSRLSFRPKNVSRARHETCLHASEVSGINLVIIITLILYN